MPLPFTIDARIMGQYYERLQYLGHGQSKVCYWLTEKLVLKLRNEWDQEPNLFQETVLLSIGSVSCISRQYFPATKALLAYKAR